MSLQSEHKADTEGSSGQLGAETDRYGFLLGNGETHSQSDEPCPQLVRHREMKWLSLMNQWDQVLEKKTSKIKGQCQKGIPASVRAKCWPLLCGATHRKEKHKTLYETLDSAPGQQSWIDVIKRDTDRQFPFHEMFLDKDGLGQQSLLRVLKAYTQFRPEEGYCQAQGPVAAVLLMNMPMEEAFWCLVQISELYLPGYYSPLLEGVLFDAAILTGVLKRTCPAAHKHLQSQGVEPLMFATDWLMCLYSRHLPFNTLLRVWDLFFCYGVRVLFQVAVVLVRRCLGDARLRKECEGQMETLERLRGVRAQVQHEPTDAFIQEVCSVPLSLGELNKQTEKELQKWKKERPGSTFDPWDRCHGYHTVWEKRRKREKENERKERQSGNLTVPLARSHSTLSLSPALLRKKWRKRGSKAEAEEWEGGGPRFSHGLKEESSDGEQRRRSVCGTAGEARAKTDNTTHTINTRLQKDHSTLSNTSTTEFVSTMETWSSTELSDHNAPVFEEDENDAGEITDPPQEVPPAEHSVHREESKLFSHMKDVDLQTETHQQETGVQKAIGQSEYNIQMHPEEETSSHQEEDESDETKQIEESQTHIYQQQEGIRSPSDQHKEETQQARCEKKEKMNINCSKHDEEMEIHMNVSKQEEQVGNESRKHKIEINTHQQEGDVEVNICKQEEEIELYICRQETEFQESSTQMEAGTEENTNIQEEEIPINICIEEKEIEIHCKNQEEETQLNSGAQEEEIKTYSEKEDEEIQLDSGAQEEEIKTYSVQQDKEIQLDSSAQEEEIKIKSEQQNEEIHMDITKQKEPNISTKENEMEVNSGEPEVEIQVSSKQEEKQAAFSNEEDETQTKCLADEQDMPQEDKQQPEQEDTESENCENQQTREEQEEGHIQKHSIQEENKAEVDNMTVELYICESKKEGETQQEERADELLEEVVEKPEITDTAQQSEIVCEGTVTGEEKRQEENEEGNGNKYVVDDEMLSSTCIGLQTEQVVAVSTEMASSSVPVADIEQSGALVSAQDKTSECFPQVEKASNLEVSTAPIVQTDNPEHEEMNRTGGSDNPELQQPADSNKAVQNEPVLVQSPPETPEDPPKPAPQASSSNPHTHLRLRRSSSSQCSYPTILSEETFRDPHQSDKPHHTAHTSLQSHIQTAKADTLPSIKQSHTPEPETKHKRQTHTLPGSEVQNLAETPKRKGLFHRLRGESSPKSTVPKILIQDFSEGEKLSAKERRRRRREQERREKEEEKERKKREKELEKEKEKERKKPQTRGKSFQVVSIKSDEIGPNNSGSQSLRSKRNSVPHAQSYF